MRDSVEAQIASFLAKYSPEIAKQLADARARLRALFPRGFELVYDNYNALVFGFSPTEKTSQGMISVAGYPKWITLFFLHGTSLADPHGLLEGSGTQVRSIRLHDPADIDSAPIKALVKQAAATHAEAFRSAPKLGTIIKTVMPKQRPRRPSEKALPKPDTKIARRKRSAK
jgi:hypothetical protein